MITEPPLVVAILLYWWRFVALDLRLLCLVLYLQAAHHWLRVRPTVLYILLPGVSRVRLTHWYRGIPSKLRFCPKDIFGGQSRLSTRRAPKT